jgi:hypothetical protein
MRIITKFVSEDGKEFMDKESCLRHEALQDNFFPKDELFWFDINWNPIPLDQLFTQVNFIQICSDNAADWLNHYCERLGYCCPYQDEKPWRIGYYQWNKNLQAWEDLEKTIAELEGTIIKLKHLH